MAAFTRLARRNRPVGIWLTLLPCWAALIKASHDLPNLADLAVFSLGALSMRRAGSTINDIADRRFDGHVERTRRRPFASAARISQAVVFLAVQLAMAVSLLLFLTSFYAVSMTVIAAHLAWQTWRINLDWPEANDRLFLANILTGILLPGTAFVGTR